MYLPNDSCTSAEKVVGKNVFNFLEIFCGASITYWKIVVLFAVFNCLTDGQYKSHCNLSSPLNSNFRKSIIFLPPQLHRLFQCSWGCICEPDQWSGYFSLNYDTSACDTKTFNKSDLNPPFGLWQYVNLSFFVQDRAEIKPSRLCYFHLGSQC